jgi:MFS transporter, UMF1 family
MSDGAPRTRPKQIAAWAAWDWGSSAFNAVVTTFVFTAWLTSGAFVEPGVLAEDGKALHTQWLGWGMALSGVLVALTAPALGAVADGSGRRRPLLAWATAVVAATVLALWFVVPVEGQMTQAVILGITLLAVGTIAFEVGSVAYNAILVQITSPSTIGRVSGIGWGAGYVGGIVLLLVLYIGFVKDDAMFGVSTDQGLNFRVAMLVAGLWFIVFALPVLLLVPDKGKASGSAKVDMIAAYPAIGRHLAHLWRQDRATVKFLIASAVFRDGLVGVFTFGGVLAAGSFGFSAGEVMIFGIAANVIAGFFTILAGWFDDRFGPRRVISASLAALIVSGLALLVAHGGGKTAFWVFGLTLAAFVGPAQAASRGLLARLADEGRETELFGLYATTGRAAAFLAPAAFATAIWAGGSQYWGILGIVVVLVGGLALFVPVRFPRGLGIEGKVDIAPVVA